MKITPRERWALKELLEFNIHRYLLAISPHRRDGGERAQRHISISEIIGKFLTLGDVRYEIKPGWRLIHDYLADVLTDRMDEVIGFPLKGQIYTEDYKQLTEKFFQVIVDHLGEMEKLVFAAMKTGIEKDKLVATPEALKKDCGTCQHENYTEIYPEPCNDCDSTEYKNWEAKE